MRVAKWTDDQPICRHPSGIPRLHGRAANAAIEAGDLAIWGHGLGAAVDGATFAGTVMRLLHAGLYALGQLIWPDSNETTILNLEALIRASAASRSCASLFRTGSLCGSVHRGRCQVAGISLLREDASPLGQVGLRGT